MSVLLENNRFEIWRYSTIVSPDQLSVGTRQYLHFLSDACTYKKVVGVNK